MDKPIEEYPDRIAELFKGKTVFITGGTGFMGKVLVEKLLRCCTEVHRIYLLIRTKKGKDPNERLKDVFSNPLYDTLKKLKGEGVLKKVVALAGDVGALGLGLSDEDRQTIINEVNIVYHCAATVRFDDPLKKAVLLNTRGTKLMLELSAEIKNLQLHAHVSTAYCHLHERVLFEKPYPPPACPHNVIKTVEWMDEDVVESITHKILGDIPNTYAFTKALGEGLVNEQLDKLPLILLRPSVVIPIWKDPLPGWTDNINGPTGLLIGAGKGVIRTMYCNGSSYADYLPVDIAVNAVLCASNDYVLYKERNVYNLTSSAEYKITWEEIIDIGRDVINTRVPLNGVVWYPGGSMKKSRIIHNICVLFFHLIPALFLDLILVCLGYKPVLWKIHKRILKGFEMFEYYANNQWDFNNDCSLAAREKLNPRENQIYVLHGDGINYHDYFADCVRAARLYILKESDESIPAAKRHMMVMYIVDKVVKTLFFMGIIYLLYTKLVGPLLNS
ncbi:PREDICTED: putative fatty acyl-CoA reductase CG5065 [Nicrophorus vespilloides]|uniref:Fatty acyl-CoA reductase n=1 Tax=Nicrophorus vespilloides TaxID=110193 RepID=A0ABM1M3N8_NICVS|nr:PREDICTED: putative fatty acyl-CoA reductase CG5065 [Nicrophorus vespilloides]